MDHHGADAPFNLTVEYLQRGVDIYGVQQELRCHDGCREVFVEFLEHPTWFCDSSPNIYEGGNWLGHVFPGTVFIFWATHWLLGLVRQYFEGVKASEQFRSKTCYRFLWFPEEWPMEAIVKAAFPPIAMVLELWLAHPGGYRRLFCADEPSSKGRYGHFIGNHINNWQHAAMYPGFIASGIVDLVSLKVDMPAGVPQAFLAIGFLSEALLFGLHGKHSPMDILVHQILTHSGLACAIFPALEAAWGNNPLLMAGRVAATYLHGAWFIAAAHMMYEDHRAWELSDQQDFNLKTDIAPVLYTRVLFLNLVTGIIMGIVAVFLIGFVIYRPKLPRRGDKDAAAAAAAAGEWSQAAPAAVRGGDAEQ